jgi:hypothetical protein
MSLPAIKSSGRDSIRDKWRKATNYARPRFTGYAPISKAMFVEVGRLTAGKATQLVYVILGASLGQYTNPANHEPFKETAADLKTSDLAELCNCDVKTIQRELADLKRRGIILWEQSSKGINVITPLFRQWASLPDYKPAPVAEPDPEPEDEPIEEGPAQPVTKRTVNVTSAPVYVRAGKQSKRYGVDGAVTHTQFLVRGNLDAECSAVLKDGVLQVILEGKWDGKKLGNVSLQAKGIEEKPRHSRGGSPSVHPSSEKRTSGESKTSHPRAAELSALFDAPIYQSCKKTLSGDPVALRKACQAVEDVPHEYLVEFLEGDPERNIQGRAMRAILPNHVHLICAEALHNWQKSKDMPVKPKKLTREEMDEMVRRDREARLARKRELAS